MDMQALLSKIFGHAPTMTQGISGSDGLMLPTGGKDPSKFQDMMGLLSGFAGAGSQAFGGQPAMPAAGGTAAGQPDMHAMLMRLFGAPQGPVDPLKPHNRLGMHSQADRGREASNMGVGPSQSNMLY